MNEGKIKSEIGKRFGKAEAALSKVAVDFDEDVIHEFRVTVKKMRAFLAVYWAYSGESLPDLSGKFKKLYKLAGRIRELQLQLRQDATGKTHMPAAYVASLKSELQRYKDTWGKEYDKKIARKARKKLLDHPYVPLPANAISDFISTRLELVRQIMAADKTDYDSIHSLRKHLKDTVYASGFMRKKQKDVFLETLGIPIGMLEEMATGMGELHDEFEVQNRAQAFIVANAQFTGRKQMHLHLASSRNSVDEHKERMVKDISKMLTSF